MPVGQQYNSVTWLVKPDKEDDFVACWQVLADWTLEACPGARSMRLLRDTVTPRKFISYSEWEDHDALLDWRRHEEFQRQFGRCRACCEELVASELTLAALGEPEPVT